MRRHDAIREIDQPRHVLVPVLHSLFHREVGSIGEEQSSFVVVHVEGGAGNDSLLQCLDKVIGVDEAATRRVDDDRILLHSAQSHMVDHLCRVIRQGAVEGHHI
ncbi:D-lactate dehydrogenase [Paramecium bursaria Chlorella virus NE-JV-1]|nr:D-lactate dehydrogenase [Paramecium bursaria Chlorella virus NE-JV-1]